MLLEKYKNKKVKLLVSSNSGAGIGAGTGSGVTTESITSTIVAIGEITDYDDELIELSNVKMIRMNLSTDHYEETGTFSYKRVNPIGTEDSDTILVNKNKIITYSIMK